MIFGVSAEERAGLARSKAAKKRFRWARYIALTVVVLLLMLTGGAYGFARRSLPQVTGTLSLPGLSAPVTVYRDAWGVPHIEAATNRDLYMAQGFVTAQDRLWQMDLNRRAASGRLAEIFGAGYVDTDKYLRTLMMRRSGERTLAALSPWALELVDAYTAGVNAFIAQATATGRLPVEFTLLGYRPEPWTALDSTAVGKYMAYDLGGNMRGELYRYQLRQAVSEELFRELLPVYPAESPTIMRYQAGADPGGRSLAVTLPETDVQVDVSGLLTAAVWPDEWAGSNNWVVSGRLTQSGKPLLANDPHLGVSTPAIWHQVHLAVPGERDHLNVIGVTFPGAPGVIVGHNEHVAWGVTNTGPDVQDLFIEKRNPDNPYQFEYMGKWEDAVVHKELIRVKGGAEVPYEVVVTRHGPIVSEVVGTPETRPKEALALKWTAHGPTTELEAVFGFGRATNWAEFRQALRAFEAPTQNFVFAAVDGTIAYHAGGKVPIRAKGDGLVPVPGWTGEYEWNGYIPFDQMPEVVNPAEGFIATANNKVVDDAYPYLITHAWSEPYRAARITEVLQSKTGFTVADMQALQADYANGRARTLLPLLLPLVEKAELSATELGALDLLKAWDYVDGAEQGAPLVFHLWYRQIIEHLYKPGLGDTLFGAMTDSGNVTDHLLKQAAAGQEGLWVTEAGGLKRLAVDSFRQAVVAAAGMQGESPQKWLWGRYHRLGPQHPVGRAVKPLGRRLNAPARPVGGSGITVAQMAYSTQTGLVTNAAVWRQVVDLADMAGNSGDVVTPGQSGHFLSTWYTDQASLHLEGKLHPQLLTAEAYRTGKKLTLTP